MKDRTKYRYVSDKYGNAPGKYTRDEFVEACAEAFDGDYPDLFWRTDGDNEWYVDEDGEIVLTTDDRH
jgi:hypothetical protein